MNISKQKQLPNQICSHKINGVCLSRMHVDEYSGNHREVMFISAHINHPLGATDLPYLPLPLSERDEVKRHESDAISAGIFIQELQHVPFNPVLLYKPQGIEKSISKGLVH